MVLRGPLHAVAVTVLVAPLASGCDSFDFGRVTGGSIATPSAAPPPSAAVASSAPSAAAEPPPRTREIVLALGGEVALGGAVKAWVTANKKYDPFAGLAPVLEGASFVFASLASPISSGKAAPTGVPLAPPAAADALARARVSAVDATSPGLFSSGPAPFGDTLVELARAKVPVAGAAARASDAVGPVRVTANGASIAVVAAGRVAPPSPTAAAFREHVALADATKLGEAVRAARAGANVVIASIGGAAEGEEAPSPEDVALARAAAEAGADVVALHGAKVPLGVAFVAGRPVLYGLGNLVADEDPKNPWSGRGFVARLTLDPREKPKLDLCPLLLADGEPKLLDGPSRATQEGIFARALKRLSSPLGAVTIGEPDLHSCFRVAEAEAAPAAGAAP